MTEQEKNKKFWEFMEKTREIISENNRCAYAFLIGLRKGEGGYDQAIKKDNSDPVAEEIAFELAVQIRPTLLEIDKEVRRVLIVFAIACIKNWLGIK